MAAPGAGKSQLWANLAQRMKVPTLYWSGDTDNVDVTLRTLAMWLGYTVSEVEERLKDTAWRALMFDQLGDKSDHIDWVFDPVINGKAIGERMNAFAEVHGTYPHLVVVDNLSNAVADPEREYAETKVVMSSVQQLARKSKAHIAVLHHANGKYEDTTIPIPQSGASQNPFKTVELGLTLWRPYPDRMAVAPVKNRGGLSDPKALHPINFGIDFSRATVHGYS